MAGCIVTWAWPKSSCCLSGKPNAGGAQRRRNGPLCMPSSRGHARPDDGPPQVQPHPSRLCTQPSAGASRLPDQSGDAGGTRPRGPPVRECGTGISDLSAGMPQEALALVGPAGSRLCSATALDSAPCSGGPRSGNLNLTFLQVSLSRAFPHREGGRRHGPDSAVCLMAKVHPAAAAFTKPGFTPVVTAQAIRSASLYVCGLTAP